MVVAVNNASLNSLQQILIADVKIDGELLNLTRSELKQVRMSSSENKHEAAVITTQLTKSQINTYIGKLVTFQYGPRFFGGTFYGYVITINPNQDYQKDTIVDITCFGSTWPMQSGEPRFFPLRTAASVFEETVARHLLDSQSYDTRYVWPALAQTSESDWEFIQTLATRHGYALYTHNGIVRMLNPKRVLIENGVYQRYIRSDDVLDKTMQLLDFNPTTKSIRIRDNIKPSFGYFDGDNVSLTQPLTASPYRLSTDTPVRDRGMAVEYSEAWERRVDFWNQEATARINGSAHIIPGVNISVQISGNSSGRNEHDGVWFVREVQHSFTNNSFQTALKLARDNIVGTTPTNRDSRIVLGGTQNSQRLVEKEGSPSYWVSRNPRSTGLGTTYPIMDSLLPILTRLARQDPLIIPDGMTTPIRNGPFV